MHYHVCIGREKNQVYCWGGLQTNQSDEGGGILMIQSVGHPSNRGMLAPNQSSVKRSSDLSPPNYRGRLHKEKGIRLERWTKLRMI